MTTIATRQRHWFRPRHLCHALMLSVLHLWPAAAPQAEAPKPPDLVAKALLKAYPSTVVRVTDNTVLLANGRQLILDDGQGTKPAAARLANPDIKDMFAANYPLTFGATPDHDPGRARNAAFFEALYGDCRRGEVEQHLVDVLWLPAKSGGKLRVTRLNGVADRLAEVSRALDALPDRLTQFLLPAAGAYHCRPIAGTTRMSAHGYGIAVDIATKHAHYWRWPVPKNEQAITYRNAIPEEIVAIFEQHGFIWGGKWRHHDTMHFEYRPELITAAKANRP